MTSPAHPNRVSPFRPFRHRAFAVIWTGSFVSNIGTWMETVAIGVYVTQATGQAAWTGTVAALTYVPTVLLGPFGGALADRFDRRRFLVGVTLFQTLLAAVLTLLAATDRLSVAAVATIVLLAGCAFAVAMPALQAMTPDLVGTDDLLGAMSLGAAQFNLGRVVGPALAGLVITAGGLAWAFGFNVVSFGAVLVALSLVRIPPLARADGAPARVLRTIADGVVAARRDPGIRTALLLLLATTFLVSPFIGLVPAVAIKVFGRGAPGTSALVTAQGVGAVLRGPGRGPAGRPGWAGGGCWSRPCCWSGRRPSSTGWPRPSRWPWPRSPCSASSTWPCSRAPAPSASSGPRASCAPASPACSCSGSAAGTPSGWSCRAGWGTGSGCRPSPPPPGCCCRDRGRGAGDPPRPAGGDGAVVAVRGCPSAPAGGRPGPGRPG